MPAHQLPSALEMSPERWEDTYQFPKPSSNDWIIMSCRTNKRATWAAQVAADAGYSRCLIYKQVSLLLVKRVGALLVCKSIRGISMVTPCMLESAFMMISAATQG